MQKIKLKLLLVIEIIQYANGILSFLQSVFNDGPVFGWKERSKNQSPADLPEQPFPTLYINSRQNSLAIKTSVRMRLSNSFH